MTVNTTLAHAAIKSIRHAQECISSITMDERWLIEELDRTIRELQYFIDEQGGADVEKRSDDEDGFEYFKTIN